MLQNASLPQAFPNNKFSFTFIIPYRHSMDRLMNLKRTIEWITSFTGAEVILVEQDKVPKIKNLYLKNVKYVFTKSELPFNRSWGFNVGIKYSTTPIVIFGDSDLILDPQQFIDSVNKLNEYDVVSPYSSVIDLEPQEVNLGLPGWKQIARPGRGDTDNQKINLCGGIVMMRKDAATRIGGWDQSFIGWGGEDDFEAFKVKTLLTWYEMPGRVYHLFHPKAIPDTKWYQRTLQLLSKLVQMNPDELQRYIQGTLPKVGMTNLFDK